jgi:hypothetical protein
MKKKVAMVRADMVEFFSRAEQSRAEQSRAEHCLFAFKVDRMSLEAAL